MCVDCSMSTVASENLPNSSGTVVSVNVSSISLELVKLEELERRMDQQGKKIRG